VQQENLREREREREKNEREENAWKTSGHVEETME